MKHYKWLVRCSKVFIVICLLAIIAAALYLVVPGILFVWPRHTPPDTGTRDRPGLAPEGLAPAPEEQPAEQRDGGAESVQEIPSQSEPKLHMPEEKGGKTGGKGGKRRRVVVEPGSGIEPEPPPKKPGHDEPEPQTVRLEDGTLVRSDKVLETLKERQNPKVARAQSRMCLLKKMTAAERRPEDKWATKGTDIWRDRYEEFSATGVPEIEVLREQVRSSLMAELKETTSAHKRWFIYKQAFERGIAPRTLVLPETPERKKKVLTAMTKIDEASTHKEFVSAITAAERLPDTDMKGKALAESILRSIRKRDGRMARLTKILRGIPSVSAVTCLQESIASEKIPKAKKVELISLLGETRTVVSKDVLLDLISGESREDRIIRAAALELGRWAHFPEVAKALEKRLLSDNGAKFADVMDSIWDVEGGISRLVKIAQSAHQKKVRYRALDVLGRRSHQAHVGLALWHMAVDPQFSDTLRGKALAPLGDRLGGRFLREKGRMKLVREWAKGKGPLAEIARRYVDKGKDTKGVAERPRKHTEVERLTQGWRWLHAEKQNLSSKDKLEPLERKRLEEIRKRIESLEKRLETIAPSGDWRQVEEGETPRSADPR